MPATEDIVRADWDAAAGAVIGYLQPSPVARRVILAAVQGPAGSTLTVWRGHGQVGFALSRVFPADSRTYDAGTAPAPILIHASEETSWAWTGGSSAAGQSASASIRSQWGRD